MKLFVFILLFPQFVLASTDSYVDNLLVSSLNKLKSKLELYEQNYLVKKYPKSWVFYGEDSMACNTRGEKTSNKFNEIVMRMNFNTGPDFFKINIRACSDTEKHLVIKLRTDSLVPQTLSEAFKLMDNLQLREGENFRAVEFGHGLKQGQIKFWLKRTEFGKRLQLRVIGQSAVELREFVGSDGFLTTDFKMKSFCRHIKVTYGSMRSCFHHLGSIDISLKQLPNELRYYIGDNKTSKNNFDKEYSNHVSGRFQKTISTFIDKSFKFFPATSLAVNNSGESEFVKDLKQARLRLLLGDSLLARKLIEKNLEKIKNSKVKITEFD